MTSRSTLNNFGNGFIELLNVELAVVVVVVELDNRSEIADAEAAIDDLYGQLSIGGCLPAGDPVAVSQLFNQVLAAANETRSPVTEQHEVVAWLLGAKVSIEREQTINAVFADPKMLGHQPGCPKRNPAQQMLNVLERTENEFLSFLMVLRMKLRFEQRLNPGGISFVDLHFLNQDLDSPSALVNRFGRTGRSNGL